MLPTILLSRRRSCQPNIVENLDHMFAEREAVPYHSVCDRQHCRQQCGRAAHRRFSRAILCSCVQRQRLVGSGGRPPCSSQPLFIQRCKCAANMVMSKTAQAYHKQFVIHAMMLRHSITGPYAKASADHRHNRPMHGMAEIAQHHYSPKCVSDGKHHVETGSCAPHPVAVVAHFSGAVNGAG